MEQIFNKLVRDNIPNKIEANGEVAVTRVLTDAEYQYELSKKLLEEANEVINATTSKAILEELADVLEVVRAIAKLEDKNLNDVIDIAESKKQTRGGFEKRIFLEKTYDKNHTIKES